MYSTVSLRLCSTKVRNPSPLPNRSAPFMEGIHISAEGATKLFKSLRPSKALGPDELHSRFLIELASELDLILAYLFQQSQQGTSSTNHRSY